MGVRKLAYRVEKRNEGFYILIQFSTDTTTLVKEIERRMRVTDSVMKWITVRIDENLKKLEKRKLQREKRAKRRPQPQASPAPPAVPLAPAMPGEAPAAAGPSAGHAPARPAPAPPVAPAPVARRPNRRCRARARARCRAGSGTPGCRSDRKGDPARLSNKEADAPSPRASGPPAATRLSPPGSASIPPQEGRSHLSRKDRLHRLQGRPAALAVHQPSAAKSSAPHLRSERAESAAHHRGHQAGRNIALLPFRGQVAASALWRPHYGRYSA